MMPSDPDKKMDDLLKTYARKRREDAGEPLEMHPATRRLLQAEAAKLRSTEEPPRRTRWSWLFLSWPRVGFAVGILTVLAIAVWNGIPHRNQSSSPMLLAQQDKNAEAESQQPLLEHNEALKAQPGGVPAPDKDLANLTRSDAEAPGTRLLDEARSSDSLGARVAPAEVKLKEESTARGFRSRQTAADGLKHAESEAAPASTESRLMVRKLDAAATPPRVAPSQPANRPVTPLTNALAFGVSPAPPPGIDSRGKQVSVTASAPAGPAAVDSYSQLPLASKPGAATKPGSSSDPLGTPVPTENLAAAYSVKPVPALPSNNSATLAINSRDYEAKKSSADFGVASKDGKTGLSEVDRSQVSARATGASGVLFAKEAFQSTTQPGQYFRFQRLAEQEKSGPAKAAMVSAPASVMATFEIHIDGDRVRVNDGDGSVYAGGFVTGAELGQARYAELGEELARPAPPATEPRLELKTADVARRYSVLGNSLTATNRIFRVNGTNRTYGQLVTFEALLAGGPEASGAGESLTTRAARRTAPTSPRLAGEPIPKTPAPATVTASGVSAEIRQSRRLVGLVRIGASNEFKLVAEPVATK